MLTLYLIGLPIATLLTAAFDPTDEQEKYRARGAVALVAGFMWPLIALGLLVYGIAGVVGRAGEHVMEYALNKWPDVIG